MTVSCRDFERRVNARMDERREASAELLAHAAVCSSCAGIASRYRRLELVLPRAHAPTMPEGLADRILLALECQRIEPTPRVFRLPERSWRWAAAASVLVAASLIGARVGLRPKPTVEVVATVSPVSPSPRPLAEALSDATEATWTLARATSAPAARLGRQVIDSATVEVAQVGPSLGFPTAPTTGMLRSVGEGLNQGVRPLGGSARHAFGFLLGPARTARAVPADRDA